jgi:site-specific DNA-methyltransferase (adenine-specific)
MDTTWATPKYFFDALDKEFNFTLDPCAFPDSAKCNKFFTPEVNGLNQDWSNDTFFMNPPYGRGQDVYSWVKKAYESSLAGGTGVCLLPLSGDTKWFHEFVMKATEIRFVSDRIWFELNGVAARANHASVVVIFLPNQVPVLRPVIGTMTNCRIKKIK